MVCECKRQDAGVGQRSGMNLHVHIQVHVHVHCEVLLCAMCIISMVITRSL